MDSSVQAGQFDQAAGANVRRSGPVSERSEPPSRRGSDQQLGLAWVLRLRWGAIAGQLVALTLLRTLLAVDLPYLHLLVLVAFTALTNASLMVLPRRLGRSGLLALVLVVDVSVLTAMLALSGAASNPFTVFFLVHVALAALLLEPRLAWGLVVLTVGAFGLLFLVPPGPMMLHQHGGGWSAHLAGMWIAYGLAAAFVAHFVGKVSRALRERDRRLSTIARLALPNERLATLSSFSANAAHELGSPLATIGLAAKELVLGLQQGQPPEPLLADAELVCREVARCRDILAAISARAGESMGEMPALTTPERVLDEVRRSASPPLAAHLRVRFEDDSARSCPIVAPPRTLAQMLHNLVRNAFEAQEERAVDDPVELSVVVGERVCFHVLDRGPGFPEEVRSRFGEPFVTTKAHQGGLGLGIYLARAYAERTGGHLQLHARTGGGADVELCLARDAVGVRQ